MLNIACFNFFFIEPRLSFAVSDAQYLVTFAVMLLVALTIATLTASVRQQTRVAGARERRTAMLYGMSRELAAARGRDAIAAIAVRHVAATFGGRVGLLFPDREHHVVATRVSAADDPAVLGDVDLSIAQWVLDHARAAGLGTDALPAAPAIYLPLQGAGGTLGVLAVLPENRRRVLLPEQRHLLDTFAGQVALALERVTMAESAEASRLAAETEALRNTLLASISHDLRTPLAVISGAGSALADPQLAIDPAARAGLAASIVARAQDMTELIGNVLELVRFESGQVPLRREWQTIDDVVGIALARVEARLAPRRVELDLPDELPPLRLDAGRVAQVLVNLLENASRHTPPTTRVYVRAWVDAGWLKLVVEDDGPGLPAGDPERLFAKFQRGREESEVPGAGLGLAICRAIVGAHGGQIEAGKRAGGGARFEVRLPLDPAVHAGAAGAAVPAAESPR